VGCERRGASTIVAQQQRESGEPLGEYAGRVNLGNTAAKLGGMARRALPTIPAGLALSQIVLPVQEAVAKGGENGLIEGKAVALIHPLVILFTTPARCS
jgi:hypothetical protein